VKEILLFSGGIDSYIAWEYLKRPQTLYLNLNHKYLSQEINSVLNLIPSTIIRSLEIGIFEENDANIPMRNLYMTMYAVNMNYDKVWLIVQKDEMSIPDRNNEFFIKTSDLLSILNNRKIIVDTPFRELSKVEMVEWYVKNNFSIDKLKETWACYSPIDNKPCGNCGACFRRFISLSLNKIEEDYFKDIKYSDIAKTYLERANNNYYSNVRNSQIKEALI